MSQLALAHPSILQIKEKKRKEKEKQYSNKRKRNNDLADLPSHDTISSLNCSLHYGITYRFLVVLRCK